MGTREKKEIVLKNKQEKEATPFCRGYRPGWGTKQATGNGLDFSPHVTSPLLRSLCDRSEAHSGVFDPVLMFLKGLNEIFHMTISAR